MGIGRFTFTPLPARRCRRPARRERAAVRL